MKINGGVRVLVIGRGGEVHPRWGQGGGTVLQFINGCGGLVLQLSPGSK